MTTDHGLYYVDRTGGELLRLDTDDPITLPGARRQVLRDQLAAARTNVTRDTRSWGAINNLAQAEFSAHSDELRPGVYYACESPGTYDSPYAVTLLSGDLFPWKVQGDEKPTCLSLIDFAATKVA